MFLPKRLFLQVCALVTGGLAIFAIAVLFMWDFIGEDQFNQELFQKTTALSILLLPETDASADEHQIAADKISSALEIDITIYGQMGSLLAATGEAAVHSSEFVEKGVWYPSNGKKRWSTQLADDRILIIDLDRVYVLNEKAGLAVFLVCLAIAISIILYPLIRRVTSRLERLRESAEQIRSGDFAARVAVEGRDEVAALAESFNGAADEIERLISSQRMLVANASHELRTPLSRIRMGIGLLKSSESKERRKAIQQDISELDTLIDELILMTRLDSSLETDRFENVDLLAIAAEECVRFRRCNVIGQSVFVEGNPRMLQRLIRNLVENAFKHGLEPITVEVTEQDNSAQIKVSDQGEGIDEEMAIQVFEPFYRGRGKQNVPGSGLGLALVKKIADAHNGQILIETSPSSTITFIMSRNSEASS